MWASLKKAVEMWASLKKAVEMRPHARVLMPIVSGLKQSVANNPDYFRIETEPAIVRFAGQIEQL